MPRDHDVVILGGGSGLTAAYHAEADGLDVAVVEPGPLGGTCVNRGCIPTKTLVRPADLVREVQRAGDVDVHLPTDHVDADLPAALERMRSMREDNVAGSDGWIENSEQITLYRDRARFVDDTAVELADAGTELQADTVFVTTGARPLVPPVDGLDEVEFLTNRTILDEMTTQPGSLAIVGGGYIGLEFAHVFSAFGTEVTIFDGNDQLAMPEDPHVRERLTEKVGEYADLHLGAFVDRVAPEGGKVRVEAEEAVVADEVLVAAGRRPNTEDLGLEAAGVETTERGWIEADATFQTSNPDVYAYGDVIGRGMFKHTSSFEGEAAYRNSRGADETVRYEANPHALFTHPKVAGVGVTEDEVPDDVDARVETAGYRETARGVIEQAEDAFAKAIVDQDTREILGFHAIGPQAPALVHEVVVAMTAGEGTVDNVTDAIHVHPTLSELVHTLFTRV